MLGSANNGSRGRDPSQRQATSHFSLLTHQFGDSPLDLEIAALSHALGIVHDFDIGLDLGFLHVVTLLVQDTDLRYPEQEGRVLLKLPPYGGAGAGHWHTDEFADVEVFIGPREKHPVRIIAFVGNQRAFPIPFVSWFPAQELAAREEFQVRFSREESIELIMQVAATVVTSVSD